MMLTLCRLYSIEYKWLLFPRYEELIVCAIAHIKVDGTKYVAVRAYFGLVNVFNPLVKLLVGNIKIIEFASLFRVNLVTERLVLALDDYIPCKHFLDLFVIVNLIIVKVDDGVFTIVGQFLAEGSNLEGIFKRIMLGVTAYNLFPAWIDAIDDEDCAFGIVEMQSTAH